MTTTTSSTTLPLSRATFLHNKDGTITLAIPNSDYRISLLCPAAPAAQPNKPISGFIRAHARRMDIVSHGGRFIEPLYGKPRRIQGTVVAIDERANKVALRVHDNIYFLCTPPQGKSPADFHEGDLLATDIITPPGALFEAAR